MKKEKQNQHPEWQTTAKERFSYYLGLISPYTMSGMMGSFLTTYLLLSGIGLEVSAVLLLVMKIIDGFDDLLFGWAIDRFRPEQIREYVEKCPAGSGILYMDSGVLEPPVLFSAELFSDITATLMKKGILVTSRLVPDGIHSEKCWRKQLPFIMNTLLYDLD